MHTDLSDACSSDQKRSNMKIDVNGIQDELDIDMRNQDIIRQRLNK